VVSALGMRTRAVPLFHWVATLGKLFTHTASPVSQLQELLVNITLRNITAPKTNSFHNNNNKKLGCKKGVFGA